MLNCSMVVRYRMAVCRISVKASSSESAWLRMTLQDRAEYETAGANAFFQLLDMGGVFHAPLRAIEGDHERGVEAGGTQRLDQEGGGLQVQKPFQPAWRLGSDQRDDRCIDLQRRRTVRLDRDAVRVQHDHVDRVLHRVLRR